jgi:hypothetical protein
VVHDSEQVDPRLSGIATKQISWKEIDETYGEHSWIFSRRDSGIRIAGFLEAARLGAEVIFTLDDDCFLIGDGKQFVKFHLANLASESLNRWVTSCTGLRVRGMPYVNHGKYPNRVLLSHGLWCGTPDLDAIGTFSEIENTALLTHYRPLPGVRAVPSGQLIPICGMNIAFPVELLWAMYWPIQGGRYRWFDDIWGGLIAQKVIESLGGTVTTGEPHVFHSRASNPFVNLEKEAPGVAAHERY